MEIQLNVRSELGRKYLNVSHIFLSEVVFTACPKLAVIKNFRGISKTMVVKLNPEQSVYFQNSELMK